MGENNIKYKKGITFGAFEYVHIGHIKLFQRIKEQCETLIVCVSDDNYIFDKKGHKPQFSYKDRVEAISSINEVDFIYPQGLEIGKKELIELTRPDAIFVGDDWNPNTFEGEGLGVPVVYLPRTKGISSTAIRNSNREIYRQNMAMTIVDLEKLLPEHDIYLQFGTLLGAVREKGMIDDDSDIDVCYMSKFRTAREVMEEAEQIYQMLYDKGVLVKYWTDGYTVGNLKNIKRPFGQAHINTRGYTIDLFTSWIDNNGDYWTCQWGNFGNFFQYFPLVLGEFEKLSFKIPKNADKILTRLYGDWRTPRKEKASKYIPRRAYLLKQVE